MCNVTLYRRKKCAMCGRDTDNEAVLMSGKICHREDFVSVVVIGEDVTTELVLLEHSRCPGEHMISEEDEVFLSDLPEGTSVSVIVRVEK